MAFVRNTDMSSDTFGIGGVAQKEADFFLL